MNKFIWMLLVLPLVVAAAERSPDESFYHDAAEAGIAEVQAGQLAEDKGQSQAVKDFGAMMVKDHSAANDKLQALAQSKGLVLPTSPSATQMATKAKLDVLSGETFDKSYIKSQVQDHRAAIRLFRQEIRSGQDADARAFARATLPTLRAHLRRIDAIARTDDIDTK